MRVIKNAKLIAIIRSTTTADTRFLFKARMRVGGKRMPRVLLCDNRHLSLADQVTLPRKDWVVEHRHSDQPGAQAFRHLVLFEGEDL